MFWLKKARTMAMTSFRKWQNGIPARRLLFEGLEKRELLSVYSFQVNTETALRDAIVACNNNPNLMGIDTITITGSINLSQELPTIVEGINIDGSAPSGIPIVNGQNLSIRGFVIDIGSQYPNNNQYRTVTISDLYICNMGSTAIQAIENVRTLQINGCGIDNTGGVAVFSDVSADLINITNNLIINNTIGIGITGDATTCNITGNTIGAHDWDSRFDGNSGPGISVSASGQLTISGNVVSGNSSDGISIGGSGNDTADLTISGNYIGVDVNGTISLPNSQNGINISGWGGQGSADLTISGNLISGNAYDGIEITGTSSNTQDLIISGNYIGVNASVSAALPNGRNGIDVSGWHGPATGWTSQFYNNTIGANGYNGISLSDCNDIAVIYNNITSNQRNGILLSGTTNDILIGSASLGNSIVWNGSSSSYHGICLENSVSFVSIIYNGFANNTGEAIATLSDSNQNIIISANVYNDEGTAPISLYEGSNHGIKSPEIDVPGIIFNDEDGTENDEWIIPISIDPCGAAFAGQPLRLEFYKYDSSTDEYSYSGYLTGVSFDAQGGFSGNIPLPASSFTVGEQIAIIAICTGGTTIGDTSEFSNVITIALKPPRVVKVEVGNSTTSDEIETAADNYTQLIPVKLDGGVDRVTITFDRPIDNTAAVEYALSVNGWGSPIDVIFNEDRTKVTWVFGSTYMAGEKTLTLTATSITSNGVALDGEWNSPTYWGDTVGNSTFAAGGHSGNGTAGGDFTFNFTLPNTRIGDANRDGIVDSADAAILSAHWLQAGTWKDGDFNGNGIVNDTDATLLAINWLQTVWAA